MLERILSKRHRDQLDPQAHEQEKLNYIMMVDTPFTNAKEANRSKTNINETIADLDRRAMSVVHNTETRLDLERQVETYAYLRDNLGAETLGQALHQVMDGNVDPKMAKKWLRDGRLYGTLLAGAVYIGYPQLRDKIGRSRQKHAK